MLIQFLLVWLLLSIGFSFSFFFISLFEEFNDIIFPSFFGLPIALQVLYHELRSAFHSATFFNHPSLGDVAVLNANFHFIFYGSCSNIESLQVPFSPKHQQCFSLCSRSILPLQSWLHPFPQQDRLHMSLHCPRHPESLCSDNLHFRHRCYTFRWCQLFQSLLWAQYFVSQSFCFSLFVWIMSRSILRYVDWIILSCSLFGAHVPAA